MSHEDMQDATDTEPLIAAENPPHMDENDVPMFHLWTIDVEDDGKSMITTMVVRARLLGFSASHVPRHKDHEGEWAPRRFQCPACRWIDVALYEVHKDDPYRRTNPGARYIAHTVGRSDIPGERDFIRVMPATNATMAIEALNTPQHGSVHLTVPARTALSQASGYDEQIAKAFSNRRVA